MSLPTSWGNQYGTRKTSKYPQEFDRHDFEHTNKIALIDSLFKLATYSLDPPPSLSHVELQDMLKGAYIIRPPGMTYTLAAPRDKIYIDDRRSHLDEAVAGELEARKDWTGHIGKHKICSVEDFYNYASTIKVCKYIFALTGPVR